MLCQGAAMRFLLTRVFDYLNLTEGALVTLKLKFSFFPSKHSAFKHMAISKA